MAIFFEITAPNGQKSYLLGTIHEASREATMLSHEVKLAFEQASLFIGLNYRTGAKAN